MAAEALAARGLAVDVYDAMPSPARKFLLAGKGGLNITHAEPLEMFLGRYRDPSGRIAAMVSDFPPQTLREWVHGLGVETFVGTSGRVFPAEMKAAPLLRAWLRRLKGLGVRLHVRHRWTGWSAGGELAFDTPAGPVTVPADAVVLALGGASWPQLGSDAAWVPLLRESGVAVAPLAPANCGFDCDWSGHFRARFAGQPLKPVTADGRRGEIVLTETGIEGGVVYALSAGLSQAIARDGFADLRLDLKPDWSLERLRAALAKPRGSRSLSSHLARVAGLTGAAAGLLREVLGAGTPTAEAIKGLPIRLLRPRPIAEAISTAGGIRLDQLDDGLMLRALPGVFAAGEMLDWDAPTGGYLLTACFASGRKAGEGAAGWLNTRRVRS